MLVLAGSNEKQRTRLAGVLGAGVWLLLCVGLTAASAAVSEGSGAGRMAPAAMSGSDETVGVGGSQVVVPVGQVLTPAGRQIELPGMRPQVLALSPDGRILITAGKTADLVVVDPVTRAVLQHVPLPSAGGPAGTGAISPQILAPDRDAQVSYTGLAFSPDGTRIFLSSINGSIKVFGVDQHGRVTGRDSFPLPSTGLKTRQMALPAGLAVSGDGRRLYVTLTLSNRLVELDASNGQVIRLFDVGAVPYGVALLGHKAYVTNWAGPRPAAGSLIGPAGLGTVVRVDPRRFIASEGSVSVIDLDAGRVIREIPVGLRPSALAVAPDGGRVFVANSGSDTVSVIDPLRDTVLETISLRWRPTDPYGVCPNALAVDSQGKTLYVSNAGQNAVAVVVLPGPGKHRARLLGLAPTGWYPGALALDTARKAIYVANIKGVGSWKRYGPGEKVSYNSHQHLGTLSLIPLPDAGQLAGYTRSVLANDRAAALAANRLRPRGHIRPRPVPERVGEPSVFHHVVYIIRENRTYDQVLGDLKEGNGDASLCTLGESVTPNAHKLAREFTLLDNTYCSSVLSADGHQWTDSALATDYVERSFAGWPRSYPDGMEDTDVDSLAYSPAGFLWDNALAHGKTLRDYGEFTIGITGWKDPARKGAPGFLDFYHAFVNHTDAVRIGCRPAIASLGPSIKTDTIGWNLSVPDGFRASKFIAELHQFEHAGRMPDLSIFCLPNDHTSGTSPGAPTPASQVADNDLALGRIVEAISHSRFWRDTCIFVIEDDPQAGWDHVDAYRTVAFAISAYTRRRAVVHTDYDQPGMVRTIELILGLPPMNLYDAAATPMTDCFMDHPDLTPYTSVPNQIPLDQLNPAAEAITDPLLRQYALASARLPLEEPDRCPEDLLNHILWYARKEKVPYPVWAVHPVKDD